jgi:nucleoside-diphosphate-sugar epimerase
MHSTRGTTARGNVGRDILRLVGLRVFIDRHAWRSGLPAQNEARLQGNRRDRPGLATTAARSCSAEQLYDAFAPQLTVSTVRVGRFHNVFMTHGTWKPAAARRSPAALCRKIAELPRRGRRDRGVGQAVEQTRSFLYVDEAVEAVIRLMRSDYKPAGQHRIVRERDDQPALPAMIAADRRQFRIPILRLRHMSMARSASTAAIPTTTLIEYVLGWKPTAARCAPACVPTYAWIETRG